MVQISYCDYLILPNSIELAMLETANIQQFPPEKPIKRHVLWFLKGFSHRNTKSVSERKIPETHYVFLSGFP